MPPILLIVKLFLTVALIACVAAPATAQPAPPPAVHYSVAPADEYFGRLKLSILGVRNTLRDLGRRADADPANAGTVLGPAGLTADAIRDWERKYPADSWVPKSILALERLYAKVDSDEGRALTVAAMAWLVRDYPASPEGRLGRNELASGLVGVKPSPPPSPAPLLPSAPLLPPADAATPQPQASPQ